MIVSSEISQNELKKLNISKKKKDVGVMKVSIIINITCISYYLMLRVFNRNIKMLWASSKVFNGIFLEMLLRKLYQLQKFKKEQRYFTICIKKHKMKLSKHLVN